MTLSLNGSAPSGKKSQLDLKWRSFFSYKNQWFSFQSYFGNNKRSTIILSKIIQLESQRINLRTTIAVKTLLTAKKRNTLYKVTSHEVTINERFIFTKLELFARDGLS